MTSRHQTDPLDVDGPAAPPRQNGELVFTAPWQSRMFAATMRLQESGRIEWEQFRVGLIAQIADHERELRRSSTDPTEQWDYWGCWQRALEGLLSAGSVVADHELDATAAALTARPPGHDHGPSHDHSPDHSHSHDGSHSHSHSHD